LSSFGAKLSALESFAEGYRESIDDTSAVGDSDFDEWKYGLYENVISRFGLLTTTEDSERLAEISLKWPAATVSAASLPLLEKSKPLAQAGFLLVFGKAQHPLSCMAEDNFKQIMNQAVRGFWSTLSLDDRHSFNQIQFHRLEGVLNLTEAYVPRAEQTIMTMQSLTNSLSNINEDMFLNLLIPLIKMIVAGNHSIFQSLDNEDPPESPRPEVETFVRRILHRYVETYIKPDPTPAADNWTRSFPKTCSAQCVDCNAVRKFLLNPSPSSTVLRLKVNMKRREHLDSVFHVRSEGAEYTVEVDKRSSTHTWVLHKKKAGQLKSVIDFNRRLQQGRKLMKELETSASQQGMPGLKQYLGAEYDAIVSCRAEDLATDTGGGTSDMIGTGTGTSGAGMTRRQPLSQIAANAVMVPAAAASSSSPNSKKRKHDSTEAGEDNENHAEGSIAKRVATEHALQRGDLKILDLTDE
jgi:hypothetical protein